MVYVAPRKLWFVHVVLPVLEPPSVKVTDKLSLPPLFDLTTIFPELSMDAVAPFVVSVLLKAVFILVIRSQTVVPSVV